MTEYRLIEVDRATGLPLDVFDPGVSPVFSDEISTVAEAVRRRKEARGSIPHTSALVIVPVDTEYARPGTPVRSIPTRDVEEVIRLIESLAIAHGLESTDRPQLTLNDVEWHPSTGYIIAGMPAAEYLYEVHEINVHTFHINNRHVTGLFYFPHNPPTPLAWAV